MQSDVPRDNIASEIVPSYVALQDCLKGLYSIRRPCLWSSAFHPWHPRLSQVVLLSLSLGKTSSRLRTSSSLWSHKSSFVKKTSLTRQFFSALLKTSRARWRLFSLLGSYMVLYIYILWFRLFLFILLGKIFFSSGEPSRVESSSKKKKS